MIHPMLHDFSVNENSSQLRSLQEFYWFNDCTILSLFTEMVGALMDCILLLHWSSGASKS